MQALYEYKPRPKNKVYQYLNRNLSDFKKVLNISSDNEWSYLERTITSAELLAMTPSGIEILPAPGAGKMYDVYIYSTYTHGTTSYNATFTYRLGTVSFGGTAILANTSVSYSAKYYPVSGALADDRALNLYTATSPVLNGDGDIKIRVYYRIINL
jgi:hypothetical protein